MFIPLTSQAADFFIGIEGTPYIAWKDCNLYVYCTNDDAKYGGSINGHGKGEGVRVGYWLSPTIIAKHGIEIGYEKLGSFSGSTQWFPNGCTLPFCNGPSAIATWKSDGAIVYADWFGYMRNQTQSWQNGLLLKSGFFASTVKTEGNYGVGGGTYTRKVSGAGIVLGTGYMAPLTQHLSARASFDMFFGVKVADPTSVSNTISYSLFNFALGVDYTFL
jgi:hypothetical protein